MSYRARQTIAGVLTATAALLSASQTSRAEVAELLPKLNLTAYIRPTKPPPFSGRTADGRTVSLASLQGKVVLLNFWAAWCQECRPEMPLFERLHRDFGAQGLSVIGINTREGKETVVGYGKELDLTFPLVLDPRGKINADYGVIGLPTTFLIARDGRAVALAVGARDWSGPQGRAIIKALLAEPAAVKGMR